MAEHIYLIDGSAFIYRAFHAVAPLTNSSGFQTNAVFGFVNMIRRLLKERSPEHLVVVFDSRGPVFRHELYPDYKANRPQMPEELAGQIPYIKELVRALGIKTYEEQGVEADDIIGAAARWLATQGHRVIIVSGDKDLLQLVDERIKMWDPMSEKVMDVAAVEKKYQVAPARLLDCFALMGDSSDNVPGVPGIGPKTAAKLIKEHGSLDRLYQEIDTLKASKMKDTLLAFRESAYLSRDLIRLKEDVAIPMELSAYRLGPPDDLKLRELYGELEFSGLLKELGNAKTISTEKFTTVMTTQALQALTDELRVASYLAIDTETTSLNSREAELVGISLATVPERCWYIPIAHRDDKGNLIASQLGAGEVKEALKPFLQSISLPKIGHNLKYDYVVLKYGFGLSLDGPLIDTMIAAYLIEPARRSYKLDDLSLDLELKLTSYDQVTGGDRRDGAFARVAIDVAAPYSCEDVYAALLLWRHYDKLLDERNQQRLFNEVEMGIVPILAEMEYAGIEVDPVRLDVLAAEFTEKLKQRERRIHECAGHSFNINSPRQLGVVLFEELGLAHGRKTKTGYSTDNKVLEKLAVEHELPALIIDYRNLAKLLSTYVDKLKQLIDSRSGRVHTSFNQTVTTTGRLSSSSPNLQNIPVRGGEGSRIREAFVPAKGKVFLFGDYSQIDLRVLAHYSQDPALLSAFRQGEDIHTRTAEQIFSVSPLLVTSEMRRVAKSINFGIVYGMSSFGLAGQLKISRKEAQRFIDRYFHLYSGVKTFMAAIVEQARAEGFVTTLLHRRRYLPEIKASNKMRREFAERAAINTPIQGTAADIIKRAMLDVDKLLQDRRDPSSCRMLLQIHDELVFEVDEDEVDVLLQPIRETMEAAMELTVPLVVNMDTGRSLAK